VSRRIEGLFCAKSAAGIRKKSGLKPTAEAGHTATTEKKKKQKSRLKPGLYIGDGRRD
jgi:hypothetical protein